MTAGVVSGWSGFVIVVPQRRWCSSNDGFFTYLRLLVIRYKIPLDVSGTLTFCHNTGKRISLFLWYGHPFRGSSKLGTTSISTPDNPVTLMARWTYRHENFLARRTPASKSACSSPHGQFFVDLCELFSQLCCFRSLVGQFQPFYFLALLLIHR